jgi:hypothetical protein
MAKVGRSKFGAKKKASKSKGYDKVQGTLESILEDISNGAKIEKRDFWMKTEYWIVYKEGGQSKISKRIYDKIVK